jgi:hypothetical protein
MNDTIIKNEKLAILKNLVNQIELNTKEIKHLDNVVFVLQNFMLTDKQGALKKDLKKLNRKMQKEINETIKNL